MEIIKFIPPRVPLTDPRTGVISREWFLFLQGVFERVGGATGPSTTDISVSLFEDAGTGETNATIFAVDQALSQLPVPGCSVALGDQTPRQEHAQLTHLQCELNGLRELVAEMTKEIQALKQAIPS